MRNSVMLVGMVVLSALAYLGCAKDSPSPGAPGADGRSTEGATPAAAALPPVRPPAVPLVAHDPYFSVWSFSNELNKDWPRHWTGAVNAICAMVRVDDKAYVLAGNPRLAGIEPMAQKSVEVWPTRTVYTFEGAGVAVTLTFLTPALPQDLDVLSRPVTYVQYAARSTDGKSHAVKVYTDVTGEWVVDKADQPVAAERFPNRDVLRIGSKDQKVLARKGDNLRIEWGHLYLAPAGEKFGLAIASADDVLRPGFARDGRLPEKDEENFPRAANDKWPALASVLDLGSVGKDSTARHLLLAYDDEYSIEYMTKKLQPWWRRNGMDAGKLLEIAEKDFAGLMDQCTRYDERLMKDLRAVGGERYARLCALAFRQALAAHKLVAGGEAPSFTPLYFSKENFSNGCIATVDVTYPSAPMFLLFNPTLLKGMTTPILDYAQKSGRWNFPFAPHDLGQYPKANGQVYGGGERTERNQMPVEESGNMLIMLAALAHVEGNADYAKPYWSTLTKWAAYLKEKGLDPENQLCTDDFAGHLAHNTNLSLKAIVALAGYAKLAEMLGHKDEAATYLAEAKQMAAKWQEMAKDVDADGKVHYRLTFDKPGTWSQKYNLVWDKLLGYDIFPKEMREQEIAFYKTKLNKFGLPLDNRKAYTKIDWILWTATLADREEDFQAIISPSYDWLSATSDRVPMTDWYDTVSGKKSGFQARSVVGGLFIKCLENEGVWKKYAAMAK